MRLYLINPHNPVSNTTNLKGSRWQRYRVWKPLNLLVLAGLTPRAWDITVFDENLGVPDYATVASPDLVGITAFTSQAERAYEVAAVFRRRGVPVVMGGIHASMRPDEALERVDAVVTGEAESVWGQVLQDVQQGALKQRYTGEHVDLDRSPPARHDLLPAGYFFGSIQTTRGCPLNCSFCSVTTFNGRGYRNRPIEDVLREFKLIREKHVLIVDDNLIGTREDHIARAKELFRAMIEANLGKRWIAQVTINMGDDDELVSLAAKAGCMGVFIGFESATDEGLVELRKRYNMRKNHDLKDSVRRMQRHGIAVLGSFIMGLDVDTKGIGLRIADAADSYGVDLLDALMLTPLPGTQLWHRMEAEGRLAANRFPEDWKYYTLTFPTMSYEHLSWADMVEEADSCNQRFYSYPRIARRVLGILARDRKPVRSLVVLVVSLSARYIMRFRPDKCRSFDLTRGASRDEKRHAGEVCTAAPGRSVSPAARPPSA